MYINALGLSIMIIIEYCENALYFCTLVWRKIKERSVHTSVREARVTDVSTGHQTGFFVEIKGVTTRQEISKHISSA